MTAHRVLQDLAKSTELEIVDPGNGGTIAIDRSMGICSVVSTGSDTRKLASPARPGIIVTVCHKTDGGSVAISGAGGENLSSVDGTSTTTMTMADAGDSVTFISIRNGSNIQWSVLANSGGTLS